MLPRDSFVLLHNILIVLICIYNHYKHIEERIQVAIQEIMHNEQSCMR